MTLFEVDVDCNGRRKGLWTEAEDQLLREAVLKLSASKWIQVAKFVPGRSAKSCRLRWCNQLRPCINKAPFSEWETAVLAVGKESLGQRWADLARLLHNRTDNAVKNQWKWVICRHKSRIWKQNRYLSAKPDVTLAELLEIDDDSGADDDNLMEDPSEDSAQFQLDLTHASRCVELSPTGAAALCGSGATNRRNLSNVSISSSFLLDDHKSYPHHADSLLPLSSASVRQDLIAVKDQPQEMHLQPLLPCGFRIIRGSDQQSCQSTGGGLPESAEYYPSWNSFSTEAGFQEPEDHRRWSNCSTADVPSAPSFDTTGGNRNCSASSIPIDLLGLDGQWGPQDMDELLEVCLSPFM